LRGWVIGSRRGAGTEKGDKERKREREKESKRARE